MVINISVQYNGGLLPDIILLTQGDNVAHEKTFVGGNAPPNERRAVAKANYVRKP